MQERDAYQSRPISMSLVLLLGLLVFVAWAALFEIDETVRARGQFIPSAKTQIIQAADGGVVAEILVAEGEVVSSGQRLALLEPDRTKAVFQESRTKNAALQTALDRAKAEAMFKIPEFSRSAEFPEFVEVQKSLFLQKRRALDEELSSLNEALSISRDELKLNENLFATSDTSRLEVMRAKRQVAELQGRVNALRNKYLQDAQLEVTKLEEEISLNAYKIQERQSMLDHTELTSPVDGVVKFLRINTIGAVLRPGDELMQISPTEGDMVIEAKINPMDIGQLKLGLPVTIKLDAFDYTTYGTMQGELMYISSDTLMEEASNGNPASSYYRANVRVDHEQLAHNPKLVGIVLKPGMAVTVDIRTNSHSILRYIAKPIYKAFGGALNER